MCRRPYYVPLVSSHGEFAVLDTPDALRGVQALVPDDEELDNRCPARIAHTIMAYRPVTRAGDVDAPVFVARAMEDTIISARSVDRLVRELDDVERIRYPIGHLDAYGGEPFETLVDREIEFLVRHLRD